MSFRAVPLNGETWLICGGRDFVDRAMFDEVMSALIDLRGCPSRIVEGGAKGADRLAAEWGDRMGLSVAELRADWKAYGRSAGTIRNEKMLREQKPHAVVAFPGGKGTADMVRRAHAARDAGATLDVIEIQPKATPDRQKEREAL